MMLAEKSSKTKEIYEGSQVPFSVELREFVTLSRKRQTQFLYTAEYHRCRKFQFHEKNSLEEFITYTMFFKYETTLNMEEEQVVKSITERMIVESKKYNCEVHFNVIWVYYFTYRDKEINSLPVFKIHKGRSNEAVYLDAFSKVYQTWNCYIDNSGLGESLLCVPRNGEYCFDGGELNLEYVLTKSLQLECSSTSSSWMKHVAPLPQCLKNWVRELTSWLLDHPKIYSTVKNFMNSFKEVVCSPRQRNKALEIALAIICAFLQPGIEKNGQFARFCYQGAKIVWIYCSSQENFAIFSNFLTGIEKMIPNIRKHYPELEEILQLLKKPSKDWVVILDSFCCLIKKIQPLN